MQARFMSVLISVLMGLGSAGYAAAPVTKPKLLVYTYDSFQSKWGPGPKLKEEFVKECQCELEYVTAPDAGALMSRLRLEKSAVKADVVLGLDSTVTGEAKGLGIFSATATQAKWSLPVKVEDLDTFQPVDFGWYAFMIDTLAQSESAKNAVIAPTSLEQLLNEPSLKNRIIVQDPRSSSVGLGLMLWIHARFGDDANKQLKKLSGQVLAVGQGWSDTYSKFTKGEAPVVFSYTTSEAYHREEEKTERYRALSFTDGHYLQIEVAGVVKTSKQQELASRFMKFLATPAAQRIIAHGNWMYPVIDGIVGMPKSYDKLPMVIKSLYLPASKVQAHRKKWTDEWVQILSAK